MARVSTQLGFGREGIVSIVVWCFAASNLVFRCLSEKVERTARYVWVDVFSRSRL
jgi:hypothetical protein